MFRAKVITLMILGINSAAASLNALYAAGPVTPPMFRIESQWNLGGAGGWGDPLLDSATHSLYIPRTDRVMVVDIETGKESAEVTGFVGVRNIALDDSGRFGYVTDLTDGTAGFVRVFDRTSLKIVASVPVGLNPDAISFEPTTKTVFIFSTSARNASILDTATNHVVATIALPARPSSAVADGKGAVLWQCRASARLFALMLRQERYQHHGRSRRALVQEGWPSTGQIDSFLRSVKTAN